MAAVVPARHRQEERGAIRRNRKGRSPCLAHQKFQCSTLNFCKLPSEHIWRTDKTASTMQQLPKRRGQPSKEVLQLQIYMLWTDLFSRLNIYYFIHSLTGKGLMGFTGTTAALLFYNCFWQPHQMTRSRGKKEMDKTHFLRSVGLQEFLCLKAGLTITNPVT